MGMLQENKSRKKISNDPNNTKWTRDTTTFGQKILRSQGWQPGQFLGAQDAPHAELHSAASASYIRVVLKDDMKGLGFNKAKEDEVTGLDVFSDLLSRLNGKSEAAVQEDQNARLAVKTNRYVEMRWGPMRFVRGGLLVGDKLEDKNDDDDDAAAAAAAESEPASDAKKSKKDKSSKKRKADDDENKEDSDSEVTTEKKDKKRRRKDEDKDDDKAERKKRKKEEKKKDKKKSSSKKSSKPKADSDSDEASSSDEDVADEKAAKKKAKKEKKEKKREKRAKKEEKKRRKAAKAAAASSSDSSSSDDDSDDDETGTSTPATATVTSGASTPMNTRNFSRSRYIAQKKQALLDAKALNQIFMVKA